MTDNPLTFDESNLEILQGINQRVCVALTKRIESSLSFTTEEVNKVHSLDYRLFPPSFPLPPMVGDELRMIARFSRCELKLTENITSHRKFIGPLIVKLKQLTWPLIRVHLKDVFISQEEFNSRTLETLARLISENARLQGAGQKK